MISWRPAGDAGLLIEPEGPPALLAAAITRAALPGVIDVVPGARTVLVITGPDGPPPAGLAAVIAKLPLADGAAPAGPAAEIPVVYDGPDLAEVARLTGLTAAEVAERHAAAEYTVGWLGFSPGFGYLTGLDERLAAVPRLASPRASVPAGSVAVAGGLTAVYPASSPGGWRLIGRTALTMWDPGRDPPSLLSPGQRVRFRAVPAGTGPDCPDPVDTGIASTGTATGTIGRWRPRLAAPAAPALAGGGFLEVVRPGPLATVQDLGRHGYGAVGVPPSGAADPDSLITANRLAGNPDGAAGLELTLGRAVFRCRGDFLIATAGAPAVVTVTPEAGGPAAEIGPGGPFSVRNGSLVRIGPLSAGLRCYLAVAGGIATPAVLGSRSADLLSGLGGGPLRAGDRLPVGQPDAAAAAGAAAADRPEHRFSGITRRLRVIPGPRLDWFGAGSLAALCGEPYQVTPASNRTGLRLRGPVLQRAGSAELPSEGMVTGSLQVPHDGQPILLLADHPTTGGYPVIAVLAGADIGLAAQLRPGDLVGFVSA
jgi:KipI family sensor histidine kinase inhibitor